MISENFNMENFKLVLIILIFLVIYIVFLSSLAKFECSKITNKCEVTKLFNNSKVISSYDISKILYSECTEPITNYSPRDLNSGTSYLFSIAVKTKANSLSKTDEGIFYNKSCYKKSSEFNEYLNSDKEKFSFKEISGLGYFLLFVLIIAFIASLYGAVLQLKNLE